MNRCMDKFVTFWGGEDPSEEGEEKSVTKLNLFSRNENVSRTVDLHIFDSLNRHLGLNQTTYDGNQTSWIDIDIPESTFSNIVNNQIALVNNNDTFEIIINSTEVKDSLFSLCLESMPIGL